MTRWHFGDLYLWSIKIMFQQNNCAEQARLGGANSVHIAPISRFMRHGAWRWQTFSISCQNTALAHPLDYLKKNVSFGRVW